MRPSKERWLLDMAALVARRGTCLRRQVGCVLVDAAGHVLSTGYNGRPSGFKHCSDTQYLTAITPDGGVFVALEDSVTVHPHACAGATMPSGTGLDLCEAVHAEQNALLQCRDVSLIHTCYVTTEPCVTCVKLLLNTACVRIVAETEYPHGKASRLLWTTSNNDPVTKVARSWWLGDKFPV